MTTTYARALAVRVTYLCPRKMTHPIAAEALVEPKEISIDTEDCHHCGSHTKAEVYVRKCDVCNESHYVTIRWDELGSWGKHPAGKTGRGT